MRPAAAGPEIGLAPLFQVALLKGLKWRPWEALPGRASERGRAGRGRCSDAGADKRRRSQRGLCAATGVTHMHKHTYNNKTTHTHTRINKQKGLRAQTKIAV